MEGTIIKIYESRRETPSINWAAIEIAAGLLVDAVFLLLSVQGAMRSLYLS